MPCVGDSQNLECDSEGSSASLRDIWKDKVRLLWHDCVWYFCGKMGIKGNQIVSALCCMKTQKIKLNPGSFKVTQVSQGLSRSLKVSHGLSRSLMVSHRVSQGLSRSLTLSQGLWEDFTQGFSRSLTGFHDVSQGLSMKWLKVSHKGSRKSCIKVSKCVFLKISQVSSHGCSTHHISGFQVLPQFDSRCHGHHMFQNRYQQNHMRSFDCRNIDAQSCERLVIKTNVGAVIRFCHHSHSQHTGSMCETSLRERCVSLKNLMFARQPKKLTSKPLGKLDPMIYPWTPT